MGFCKVKDNGKFFFPAFRKGSVESRLIQTVSFGFYVQTFGPGGF